MGSAATKTQGAVGRRRVIVLALLASTLCGVPPAPGLARVAGVSRARTPLERSPGYYPPADPESSSVRLGRRHAKAVRLPLTGGARSLTDLAQMLIAGLEARNEKALHMRRLTRGEFEVICWPEFPESRPITRITAQDAWELSDPTSQAGVSRALAAYGGRPLSLIRVRAATHEPFRNFVLHRGVVIDARDEQFGSIVSLTFAPSVVERKGRFKVLMYKD